MFKIKSDSILEQSVTIYEFIGILFGYKDIENVSTDRNNWKNYHDHYVELLVLRKNNAELKEFENSNTPEKVKLGNSMSGLMQQLMSDEQSTDFPETQGNQPLYTYDNRPVVDESYLIQKADGITWFCTIYNTEHQVIQFSGYKVKDLVNWCNEHYTFALEKLPHWFTPMSAPIGYVEVATLPRLLQLAIEAHQHFDWIDTDLDSHQGKLQFRQKADAFFKKRAEVLKIQNTKLTNNGDEFGISKNTAETLKLIIKPDL
jgi:hypothetical protein